jgi:hypothetical protein
MALKGPLWLMKSCLESERARDQMAHWSSRGLDLGLLKSDSTRGHVFQACGAVQQFLAHNAAHCQTVKRASPFDPYKPTGAVLRDWKALIGSESGPYGRANFGFGYDTLKGALLR